MDLFSLIGLLSFIFFMSYMILPWFLDCDIQLAFKEKFGKPISSLRGKVIWITGASSGIGEELAYVLAEVGCKLILSSRRKGLLEAVKRKCLEGNKYLNDNDIEVLALDMFDFESHEGAFRHVISKFKKLDILVNNAGRSQRAEWEKIDIKVDREMFDLNVFSAISLSRLAVNYFQLVDKGHIVITSSFAGKAGVPFSATYNGTKHALHGYFEGLWIEKLTKNIDVTLLCPGPIQTNFLQESFTEIAGQKYGKNTDNSKLKMSAERCAHLMGVAIANKLMEAWISKSLPLFLLYLSQYYPNVNIQFFKILGPRFLARIRDE
ncbi:dehydrogenase/reductase SDR family member 7 [Prorops nasuta]|uniref:dehydrogenase/reductase SDR family member 7 n=1 Tax=Prorops nasuta TaxID=863751 RepID=UPI0034CDADD5